MTSNDIDKVYEMLSSQSFKDFYETEFEDHILGEEDCSTREQILCVLGIMLQ